MTTRTKTRMASCITTRRTFLGRTGLALAAAVTLGACSSTGAPSDPAAPESDAPILPEPRSVTVALSAASDANPGPTGRAAPITLRLYTLRSVGRFGTLDYFEIAEGASALSGAVVDSRTVSLRPGESRTVTLNGGTDGAYLGVAAAYRDIDSARWRGQTSLKGKERFSVRAGRASVSVSGS